MCYAQDLETEIFLHILKEQSEAITGLVDDTPSASMRSTIADGDGMVFVRCLSHTQSDGIA